MATQTLAQVRAAVKAAHPGATTAAINATARKDFAAAAVKPVATPTTASAPLTGVPTGATSTPLTPRQSGADISTLASGDLAYNLTGAEFAALSGTGPMIDFAASAAAFGATAPAYSDVSASVDYQTQLYDRLRILTNYYNNLYTGTSPAAGSASLGKAIQLTQQQLYNAVNASPGINPATAGGVAIPYNQFIAGEGAFVNGGAAVQALLSSAAPAGAPTATAGTGVYHANAGTPAYLAALGGGASSSPMPNPMVSSPVTASGPGTIYSTPVGGTGAAGGVPTPTGATAGGEGDNGSGTMVSGGGSDAGSPAAGSALGDLTSSTVAGFPLLDILLIGGAGVGLWYVSKHRRKGKKG